MDSPAMRGRHSVVAVTGVGVAVPGASTPAELLTPAGTEPVDAAGRIGKKGLRYKDQATRLGLVAGYEALHDGGLVGTDSKSAVEVDPASIGVVAGSNFGNLDAVCEVVDTIAANGSTRLVSPIMTPILSSNVIASEVAIRHGLRGPNLTVCNGATSGLDALRWAMTWLAGDRARYMLVVASEPDTEVARALGGGRIVDGAVAMVLESAESAAERGATTRVLLDGHARAGDLPGVLSGIGADGAALSGWYAPDGDADDSTLAGVPRFAPAEGWGVSSAVLGLLQCVSAIARYEAGADGPVLVVAGGPDDDASAGVLLRPQSRAAP